MVISTSQKVPIKRLCLLSDTSENYMNFHLIQFAIYIAV